MKQLRAYLVVLTAACAAPPDDLPTGEEAAIGDPCIRDDKTERTRIELVAQGYQEVGIKDQKVARRDRHRST